MSFRNVLITGGLSLAGIAVLMGVADPPDDGLLPGSAKAPGGGFLSAPAPPSPAASRSAPDRRSTAPDDGVRRAQIRPAPDGPAAADPPGLLDRVLTGALDALRAARAAGDRVFGRDRGDGGDRAQAGADPPAD